MIERIGWPGLWLAFGMLAAHEIGLRQTASPNPPALVLFYAVVSALGLWMMVRRAARARRPARLRLPLALSLAGPVAIAWLIHQKKLPTDWIDTLFGAFGFLVISACAILAGMAVAWRLRESSRDRRHRDIRESTRRRLMERSASGPLQDLADEIEFPAPVDDEDLLPARMPKR